VEHTRVQWHGDYSMAALAGDGEAMSWPGNDIDKWRRHMIIWEREREREMRGVKCFGSAVLHFIEVNEHLHGRHYGSEEVIGLRRGKGTGATGSSSPWRKRWTTARRVARWLKEAAALVRGRGRGRVGRLGPREGEVA
jgi:hypothetical protein